MKKNYLLELDDALAIIKKAQEEAGKNNWSVSIAVCDAGGTLIALHRLDNAAALSAQIAQQKAYCSAISGKPSKIYEDMINSGRIAAMKMPIISLEGGIPIIIDGLCIGAIGVSGVKAEQDAQVAMAGLAALSL